MLSWRNLRNPLDSHGEAVDRRYPVLYSALHGNQRFLPAQKAPISISTDYGYSERCLKTIVSVVSRLSFSKQPWFTSLVLIDKILKSHTASLVYRQANQYDF